MFQIRFVSLVSILTLSSAICAPALAQVQPPEVEWGNTYGGAGFDAGSSVQQTQGGGFVVAGVGLFDTGGYDFNLIKTDTLGNPVWQKTFGGNSTDEASSVQQTTDGGYIVAGATASFGAGGLDVYLVKTDSQGNQVWHNWYGGANLDFGQSVQQTLDGGYIVAGWTSSFGAGLRDVYLVKTDAGGNLEWEKTFGGAGHDEARSIQLTTDDGFIVAGFTGSFDAGLYIIKTDAVGNLLWQQTITGGSEGYSVQQTTDGGYIVAGTGRGDVFIVKTDVNGNIDQGWPKTFGGTGSDVGFSVQQTFDANGDPTGYIVAGYTDSFGAGGLDVYLVKTDARGNLEWEKTLGGASDDYAFSIQQTTDEGYIVAGVTYSFGAGNGDVYLIKLKPDQPPQPKPCSPDAEVYDEMETELSHNIEVFGLGRVCTADLTGVIGVKRYLPYVDPATGLRTIATKITKLELTGTDPSCGEVKISLQPGQASGGKVVEQKAGTCFPADSYFDVYITVAIPSFNLTLANCQPATMRCVVSTLPPIGCVYQLGTGFDVNLYDATNLDCTSPGNPVGQISSADHKPTAQPVPPTILPLPERTQLYLYNSTTNQWLPLTDSVRKDFFHATFPVVVIVHGWNYLERLPTLGPWTDEMAFAIVTRLLDPDNPAQTKVNILAWEWMELAMGGPPETKPVTSLQIAANEVYDQSKKLARTLQRLFQADPTTKFEQPIHLMGHSLGASLVAFTGLHLQDPGFGDGTYNVQNVTLFDPPDLVCLPGIACLRFPNSLWKNVPYLRRIHGTTVDCFSGKYNDRTYFSNVWYVVPGGGHDTDRWYREHALPDSEPTLHTRLRCDDPQLPTTFGFGASITHASPDRQLRFSSCLPETELDVSLVSHPPSIPFDISSCTARDDLVYAQYCVAVDLFASTAVITAKVTGGIANLLCDCTVPDDLRLRMRLRRPAGEGAGGLPRDRGGQADGLTATFTLPLAVSVEYDYASFTYRIERAPTPATLTLSIQDGAEVTPLFLATSNTDLGELADSGLLNITPFHGKEVSFIFSLTSDQPEAIVEVSNLTMWQGPFHNNLPPVANAGADQAVAVTDPLSTAVQLDGSGTVDENGDALVYAWTLPNPADVGQEGIIAVGVQPTVQLPLGGYQFTLHARDPFDGFSSADVIVEVEYPFIRGDSNADGEANIADAVATLNSLFVNLDAPLCKDAADTDDDGMINISDPIALLNYLFLGTSPAPKPPFPGVGLDPTPELLLGCNLKQH